jgi:hypothetical protein
VVISISHAPEWREVDRKLAIARMKRGAISADGSWRKSPDVFRILLDIREVSAALKSMGEQESKLHAIAKDPDRWPETVYENCDYKAEQISA